MKRPTAPPAVHSPRRPFDPATAAAALDRLSAALGDSDFSGAACALAELDSVDFPAWAAFDLARLRDCVDGYEYDEARALAGRLLARVHDADASLRGRLP